MSLPTFRHCLGGLVACAALAVQAGAAPPAPLAARYESWLRDVRLLLPPRDRRRFLALEKDYQRDAFIRRFWEAWDPTPETPLNEFMIAYLARLEVARERFTDLRDDRFRVFVLVGEPSDVYKSNMCQMTWPMEIWRYGYVGRFGRGLEILFYQPAGGGPFRIWHPREGIEVLGLIDEKACQSDFVDVAPVILRITAAGGDTQELAAEAPVPTDPEWLAQFHTFSTEAEPIAEPLSAELAMEYPGWHGQRVIARGRLSVPLGPIGRVELDGQASYNLQLTGEVLRQDDLFESFQYRFDLPARSVTGETLPLVFERHLRPGSYRLVLKLRDLNGPGQYREEHRIEVPRPDGQPVDSGVATLGAVSAPTTSVELVADQPRRQSGMVRVLALVEGGAVERVAFLLDGHTILTKTREPYSAELDLGRLPRRRILRAIAYDGTGRELATDDLVFNPVERALEVNVTEPRPGGLYDGQLRIRAEIQAPPGRTIERAEFYLGENRLAVLHQRPWVYPTEVDAESGLTYARVVAHLDDGSSAEDLVTFNSPHAGETVEVRLVELAAQIVDPRGETPSDLLPAEVEVLENGDLQSLQRLERLDDLPLQAAVVIDTSASMEGRLETVRRATLEFFDNALRPTDRAGVITFNEQARVAASLTADRAELAGALAALQAGHATALYDSLIDAIYQLRGGRGQRALIVLTDGEDRASRHSPDEVIEFAQVERTTVFAVLIGGTKGTVATRRLKRMAVETGGQLLHAGSETELATAFHQIEADLRSRYLIVYQSSPSDPTLFRTIDVRVARPGLSVRTLTGYRP